MSLSPFPPRFFITGTDTDVGKTIASALLTLGLDSHYWKPVQSGTPTDTDFLHRTTGLDPARFFPERYRLTQPLSPHAAARIDGVAISLADFQLPSVEKLIVEGAGGLLVPLNDQDLMIDLIQHLNLPVCLVTRSTLGTINHTLLSIAALRQANIPILGVIINGCKNQSNREAIAHYGNVPILAELEPLAEITTASLHAAFHRLFSEPS
jgi:dethiobiotin synthetase